MDDQNVAALVEEARRRAYGIEWTDIDPPGMSTGELFYHLAAALESQARDLADAHTALNGHATAGMPLAKRIAAALGTHSHDMQEMQRRIEEAARERDGWKAAAEDWTGVAQRAQENERRALDEQAKIEAERDAAPARAEKVKGAAKALRDAVERVFPVASSVLSNELDALDAALAVSRG